MVVVDWKRRHLFDKVSRKLFLSEMRVQVIGGYGLNFAAEVIEIMQNQQTMILIIIDKM